MSPAEDHMKSLKALQAYRLQNKIKALEALIELNTTNLDVDVMPMREALKSGDQALISVALRHIMAGMLSWTELDEASHRISLAKSKSHK